MSICEISRCAINFTIQINKSANPVTITPSSAAALGSSKDRIIFKYPISKIKATGRKTTAAQILVSRLIV